MDSDKIKVTWEDIDSSASNSNARRAPDPYVSGNDAVMYIQPKTKKDIKWRFIIVPSIVACIVLLAAVFLFFNNSENRYRKPIESVLDQTEYISQTAQNSSESLLVMVSSLVQKMRLIDLSDCPDDFQTAYRTHIKACEKLIPLLRQGEELNGFGNMAKSFIVGLIAGFTGQYQLIAGNILENAYAGDELNQAAQSVIEEIELTEVEVFRVAKKYNVDITPYSQP